MESIFLLILMANQISLVPSLELNTESPETCLFKDNVLTVRKFKSYIRSNCFRYLFQKIKMDPGKESCVLLTDAECDNWNGCIRDAEKCCSLQIEKKSIRNHWNETHLHRSSCDYTWDGFTCWEQTKAGESVTKQCPAYVSFPNNNDGLYVTNSCTENGTWNTHPKMDVQWTDYSPCVTSIVEEAKIIHLVSIYVNAASIVMLVPAIGIFLVFKLLRKEMTIRIHTSFFVSLLFGSLMRVLFTSLTIYQYLIKSGSRLLKEENQMECFALYLIHRYFQSTTYYWMFCEAFHLNQLMVNSFRPPRRTYVYHAFAWISPFFTLVIYAILRGKFIEPEREPNTKYNVISECWIRNAADIEWVIYVPLLICLFLNIVFLCHIIRRLIGMQTLPNEPSSFRRSVKAILLLFPLFGIQIVFITSRIPVSNPHYFWFSIITEIVIGSKGITVATLFCYMNGEVIYYLRKTGLTCLPEGRRDHRKNSCPTIQSDVSRVSSINKSAHYKVKPKESCSVLLTSSKSDQPSSEKKCSTSSSSA